MRGVRGMTAQEVGLYTMLLCRMYEESGPIEDHALRLSTYCGMRQATFEKTLQKLVDLGKIIRSDGTLWNDRAEIEISSRANDLKIAIKAGKASAEKRQQKQRRDATTVQRPFNHTDTDTDTVKTEAKASEKKRGTRLSEDWFLPRDWGAWAVDAGMPDPVVRREADKFRDYWIGRTGQSASKLDWQATWRNWVRKWIEDNRKAKGNGKGNSGTDRLRSFLAGAEVETPMDFGESGNPSEPLLAGRRS